MDEDMLDREYIMVRKGYRCTREMSPMVRIKLNKYDGLKANQNKYSLQFLETFYSWMYVVRDNAILPNQER